MKRKLAIDIDNTIWDLIHPWIEFYNYYYYDNVTYDDIKEYDFFSILNKANKQQMLELLNIRGFWKLVQPYEYSSEYLRKFNDEYELYIVTSTSYKTSKEKFDRFFELFPFLNESQLILTHNKRLIDVDIMIDDCPKWLEGRQFIKFLINEPYNQLVADKTIIRVDNLKDVYNYLQKLE